MKKNFLLAMVVMLMTAVSSFAQKEYNMVITLSNGTTVTLGHNDIKEITFNDGEVAISGNMVNTIDSLAQVTRDLDNKFRYNFQQNVDQDERIKELANATADGFVELGTTIDTKINNLATAVDENYAVVVNTNDGEGAVINEKGEIVIRKGKYVLLTNFGNATFGGRKGDKFGVVNQEDNPIVKFEYDAMGSYLVGENYLMKSGNYYALVNAQGEEIKDTEVRNVSLWESGSAEFIDIKSKAEAFLENIYPKGYKMFNGKVDAPSIAKALNLKLDSIDLYSNRLGISRTFEGGNILVQIEVDFDNYLKAEKFHEETTNDGWFEKTETVSDGYDWNANTTMTSLRQQIDIDIKYQDNFIDLIKKMIEKRGFKKHKNDRYYYVGENDKQIRIYIEKSDTSPAVVLTYYPQGSFIYE